MEVWVQKISIPAMNTIGYGYGTDVQTGEEIRFCGDRRPMSDLGESLHAPEAPCVVEIEPWQIL